MPLVESGQSKSKSGKRHRQPSSAGKKVSPLDKRTKSCTRDPNVVSNIEFETTMTSNDEILQILKTIQSDVSRLPKMESDLSEMKSTMLEVTQSLVKRNSVQHVRRSLHLKRDVTNMMH